MGIDPINGTYPPPAPWVKHCPDFLPRWTTVLKEYSLRYGSAVSGWWLDGCYAKNEWTEPMFQQFHDAIRAGNPNAILALNNGVKHPIAGPPASGNQGNGRYWNTGGVISRWEDFTAGESNDLMDLPKTRWVTGPAGCDCA